MNATDPVKVLYVMGSGRSGSTITDIILGNHPGGLSLGEIRNIQGIESLGAMICSCGLHARECPFWSQVGTEWTEECASELNEYSHLQSRFERYRSIPQLFLGRLYESREFERYEKLTSSLMRSIRDVSGATFVVDSSKHPLRALSLSRMSGIELYVVHLVRDGRSVAASGKGWSSFNYDTGEVEISQGENVGKLAARWLFENVICEVLCGQIGPGRSLRLRYEDLITDPEIALKRIGELTGDDFTPVLQQIRSENGLRTGHLISGNRLRMQPEVTVRSKPDSWTERLSAGEQRFCWSIMGHKLKRYGYAR